MGADDRDKDLSYRIGSALSSQASLSIIGLLTALSPIFISIIRSTQFLTVVVGVETALLVLMIGSQVWLRGAYLRLRRARSRDMSDPAYFERMKEQLERDLVAGYADIAEGRLRVFATDVARVGVQLLRTLTLSSGSSKIVRATDLTNNPALLSSRSEYLAENRRFIASGGVIKRLFMPTQTDLLRQDFAEPLLELIEQHRSIGVQCGIAVRERVRNDQAVDFVVFGTGAVLIEDQQADADYTSGRSSIEFKGVDRWIEKAGELWPEHGAPAPVLRLQQYEAAVRQVIAEGAWDAQRIRKALDSVD